MLGTVNRLYRDILPRTALRILWMPVFLSIADFSVTLYYQPDSYWAGERSEVMEGNPIARWVLELHPLLILPAMVAWYLLMIPLIFKTPARIGLRVVMVHLLGPVIAISGWLIRMREDGVWMSVLVFLLVALAGWRVLGPFRGQWNSTQPVRSLYSEGEDLQSPVR